MAEWTCKEPEGFCSSDVQCLTNKPLLLSFVGADGRGSELPKMRHSR